MKPAELTLDEALALPQAMNPDPRLTQRISDYLNGHLLGPKDAVLDTRPEVPQKLAEDDGDDTGNIAYWAGPLLPVGHPRRPEQIKSLRRAFTSRNLILEGCERLADSIGADEATWKIALTRPLKEGETPTEDESTLIAEIEAALTAWWDRRRVHLLLQRWVPALIAHGRHVLRPVIPPKHLNKDGKLSPAKDPTDAALRLHILTPDPQHSGVTLDDETLDEVGVTLLEYRDSTKRPQREAEITWVDEAGYTNLRVVRSNGKDDKKNAVRLPLGGRLMLLQAELRRGAVRWDAIQNNDQANVSYTLMGKNTHFAGLIERFGIGIDPPEELNIGPETANFFQPSVFTEEESEGGRRIVRERPIANPAYGKFDPADPKALDASINMAERNVFNLLRQAFIQNAAGKDASGRSQEVATGDYAVAAKQLRAAVEAVLRDLLELAMTLVALQLGTPNRYAGLRATVSLNVHTFPPSPEERSQNREDAKAGILSYQTARTRAGVQDPDAEAALVETETQARQEAVQQVQDAATSNPLNQPADQQEVAMK